MSQVWRAYPDTYARVCSERKFHLYDHIRYISKIITPGLYAGGLRAIINSPPRHGKSELISRWLPSWYLDTFEESSVILTSYGDALSSSFGRMVRNHFEENPHATTKPRADSSAANDFELTNGSKMVTAGVGGPITGKGGKLLICDDPYKNWEEARSASRRNTIDDWFQSTFWSRQEPNASIILNMTRWHHDDQTARLLARKLGFIHINLPAIAKDLDPMGREAGQALCPERFNEHAFAEIKAGMHSMKWEAIYQQQPTKDGGEIFNRSWWKTYKRPPSFREVWQFWDTAQKPGITNDYSVCTTWGKADDGVYLLDVWRQKVEAPDLELALTTNYNKWKPAFVQIEDKSSGIGLIQYANRKTSIPIFKYNPRQRDKESRAIDATPLVKSGRCFLPEDAVFTEDFIQEHEQFPQGEHDDQVDTTSQMAEHFNGHQEDSGPRARRL